MTRNDHHGQAPAQPRAVIRVVPTSRPSPATSEKTVGAPRKRHTLWIAGLSGCLLVAVGCATGSGAVRPKADDWSIGSLYPLSQGNAWSYVVDTGAESILTTVRVNAVMDQHVLLRSGAEDIAYQRTDDALMRVGGLGAVLQSPVTVGASWKSGPASTSTVARRVERVEVPAGSFTGCAEVVDEDAATGKRVTTTYCPGVGPALVVSELALSSGNARVSARLQGHALAPK